MSRTQTVTIRIPKKTLSKYKRYADLVQLPYQSIINFILAYHASDMEKATLQELAALTDHE